MVGHCPAAALGREQRQGYGLGLCDCSIKWEV